MLRHLRRDAFVRLLAMFPLLLWGLSASAQRTYTVFPARQKPVESSTVAAQPTKHSVTLVVSDSTIKYMINELARQAGLQPSYVYTPALTKRVTIRVVNANVMDALATVLKGTGLVATMASDGETVVIHERTGSSAASHAG